MKNTEKYWVQAKKQYASGIIIVCPYCHKVDVDPWQHPATCDPGYEARRQENEDYNYD